MNKAKLISIQERAAEYLMDKAKIVLKNEEIGDIEVITYGMTDNKHIGFQLFTYINEKRYCAKELILFPHQTCLQHKHPPFPGSIGKQETFRVRYGTLYLYVPGVPTENINAIVPDGHAEYMKEAQKEITLKAGDMYTVMPDTWHWFQSGDEGCIVSEFSSFSTDENDIISDPRVVRFPKLEH